MPDTPVPGPLELQVGQVVGQPAQQATPQLNVHGAQPQEALTHTGAQRWAEACGGHLGSVCTRKVIGMCELRVLGPSGLTGPGERAVGS
jgi:hypothetical protein